MLRNNLDAIVRKQESCVSSRYSVQAPCYKLPRSNLSSDWPVLVRRRAHIRCPELPCSPEVACECSFQWVAPFSCSFRLMVYKTLVNSWATSHRYHENRKLDCLFGCSVGRPLLLDQDVVDYLRHCICCPRLWFTVDLTLDNHVAYAPHERLGLVASTAKPIAMAMAYHVYHSIKHSLPLIFMFRT